MEQENTNQNIKNKENAYKIDQTHSLSQVQEVRFSENDQLSDIEHRRTHKRYSLSKETSFNQKRKNRKILQELKQNNLKQERKSSKLSQISGSESSQSISKEDDDEEQVKESTRMQDVINMKKVLIRGRFSNKIPKPIIQRIRRNSTGLYQEAEDLRETKRSQSKEEGVPCNICMNSYFESEIMKFGECGHRFCQNCLLEYLRYKIKSYEEPLCPEQNCENSLDESLPIFIEMQDSLKHQYQRNKNNFKVLNDPTKKFCPNPTCINQVLQQDENSTNVQCQSCQILYCFKCLYPAHKQSECDLSDVRYLEKNLKYRQCSNCHRLIEKNEGCNHIVCLCKFEFCYECGSKWTGNDHLCIDQRQEEEEEENLSTARRIFKVFVKVVVIFPVWLVITVVLATFWAVGGVGLFALLIVCSIIAPAGVSDNSCIYLLIILLYPYALYLGFIFLFKETCGPAYIEFFFISKWNSYSYFTTRYLCR